MKAPTLACAILLLMCSSIAQAAFRTVHPDGTSGQYPTIQAAINASVDGDVIELYDGTYTGVGNRNIDFGGLDIFVRSISGRPEQCIVDCQGIDRGFYFHGGETPDAILRGVTIRNGQADQGGGIKIVSSDPTIVDCVIESCAATEFGGGVYLHDARDARFSANLVRDNAAGIAMEATGVGGGVYASWSTGMTFYNNLIIDNESYNQTGGLYSVGYPTSTLSAYNCTFDGNVANDNGDGSAVGGKIHLSRSIVGVNSGASSTIGPDVTCSYSCIYLGWDLDSTCITSNPQFRSGPGGDHYLDPDSPCVDSAGTLWSNLRFPMGGFWVDYADVTTQATEADDTGETDMGYHYGHFGLRTVPGDFATVQEALDDGLPGETVEVAAGTYPGPFQVHDRSFVLRSAAGATATTLDGGGTGPVLQFDVDTGRGTVIEGFTITGGSNAGVGGGVYLEGHVWPTLLDDRIVGNSAASGGGVGCRFGAGLDLVDCWVEGNAGIGVYIRMAGGLIRGSTIVGNTATSGAGLNCNNVNVDVENSTIHGNIASGNGGGVYVSQGSIVTLTRSIVSKNTGNGGIYGDQSTVDVSCSDVYMNAGGNYAGDLTDLTGTDGNISVDPLFCAPSFDDFHLMANSPCSATASGGCGQIGAFGVGCGAQEIVVRHDGNGDVETIQDGIDACLDGGTVLLEDGRYIGVRNRDLDFLGKAITVRSQSGDPTQVTIDCEASASDPHRGFRFVSGEGSDSILRDVTIRNAYTTSSGGAIQCSGSSPTLENIHFLDNQAEDSGAGLSLSLSNATVRSCSFQNNRADNAGGALTMNTSSPTVESCFFADNWAYWGAGGVHIYRSSPTIDTCTFLRNESAHWGGALHADQPESAPFVDNCMFFENTAPEGGAVFVRRDADVQMKNSTLGNNSAATGGGVLCKSASSIALHRCTVASNSATVSSGGVHLDDSSVDFQRSIGWGNTAPAGGQIRVVNASSALVACSDVQSGQAGVVDDGTGVVSWLAGNIPDDPLFCSPVGNDFHLRGDSPCAAANNPICGQIGALSTGCAQPFIVNPDGSENSPRFRTRSTAPATGTSSSWGPAPSRVRATSTSISGASGYTSWARRLPARTPIRPSWPRSSTAVAARPPPTALSSSSPGRPARPCSRISSSRTATPPTAGARCGA